MFPLHPLSSSVNSVKEAGRCSCVGAEEELDEFGLCAPAALNGGAPLRTAALARPPGSAVSQEGLTRMRAPGLGRA
eukprot:scaffold49647_cov36-Tisochrysis_lutea.AAC.2